MTCKTMSVPEAGRIYFGLGRNGSYEAVRRGDIPVIPVGGLLRVPVIAMDRKLEAVADDALAAASEPSKFPKSTQSLTPSRASTSPPTQKLAVQKGRT